MKVIKIDQVAKEPHSGKLFTGNVTMQPIIGKEMGANLLITQVNFGRGVRNKFHSHTLEQVLIVTEGKGVVATEKEQISVVPGDVIFIPPGEKHWHGASLTTAMTHIAIVEHLDGKSADWMEKVTDEQYQQSQRNQ